MSAVLRCRFRAPRRVVDATPVGDTRAGATQPVSRIARMLALAHHVERLAEAGDLTGYSEAAQALGLTRARLTQVMKLLLLSPGIQERLLLNELVTSERALRCMKGEPSWVRQLAALPSTDTDHRELE